MNRRDRVLCGEDPIVPSGPGAVHGQPRSPFGGPVLSAPSGLATSDRIPPDSERPMSEFLDGHHVDNSEGSDRCQGPLDRGLGVVRRSARLGTGRLRQQAELRAPMRPRRDDRMSKRIDDYLGSFSRSVISAKISSLDFVASTRTTTSLRSKSSITGDVFAW